MELDDLLKSGRIHRGQISQQEVEQAVKRAERDLKTARKVMASDWDWGFAITYDAVLQASRAFMFSRGYRPASAEGHKNTLAFMRAAMGDEYQEMISYFDRMRIKRNQAIYDVAGLITQTEARNLFEAASRFVAMVRENLKRRK